MKMQQTWYLDSDTPVVFKRSIIGWVTVFGEHYVVTLKQVGNTWVARKQFGLEPIGTGKTAKAALIQAKAHYDRLLRERIRRISNALAGHIEQACQDEAFEFMEPDEE